MLSPDEVLRQEDINRDFNRKYVIWPVDGVWKVRHKWHHGWEDFSKDDFDTENADFNFAYEHFLRS